MNQQSHQIKKKQWRNLSILGAIFMGLCLSSYYLLERTPAPSSSRNVEKIDFATPLTHVDAQAVWIERAQNQLNDTNKTENALQQQIQLLQQGKKEETQTAQQLTQRLQMLQTEVEALQKEQAAEKLKTSSSNVLPPSQNPQDKFMSEVTLDLIPHHFAVQHPLQNLENFVPAGTFVRAITLGGADAAAGVTSQGDPSPMLFRILDAGTLPNHHLSHLKGCIATAAAYGDISSKRGQIRLERLSCVRKNGQVIELSVEATVFGPDGKNGVRGNDYWGESALLSRAFAAGLLSGLSNGIGQSYTSNALTPLGAIQSVSNANILKYGVASGVENASEKLADYNIKRAEQFHPVIQLSAGTVVDIVFLKGFYLIKPRKPYPESDLLNTHQTHDSNEEISTSSSAQALPPAQTQDALAPLPLTAEQIQRLKQKDTSIGYH